MPKKIQTAGFVSNHLTRLTCKNILCRHQDFATQVIGNCQQLRVIYGYWILPETVIWSMAMISGYFWTQAAALNESRSRLAVERLPGSSSWTDQMISTSWSSCVLTELCSDYDEFCRFNNLCVYHSCPWSFHWCPCLRLQLIYTTSCGRWQPATSACNFTFKPPTVTNSSTWENCFIDFNHDNGAIDGGRRRCQRSEMRWALVIAWPIWPWPWNSPMLTLILLNLWHLMWWQQFWKLCFSGISTFYIGYLSPTASQMCLRQTS